MMTSTATVTLPDGTTAIGVTSKKTSVIQAIQDLTAKLNHEFEYSTDAHDWATVTITITRK